MTDLEGWETGSGIVAAAKCSIEARNIGHYLERSGGVLVDPALLLSIIIPQMAFNGWLCNMLIKNL